MLLLSTAVIVISCIVLYIYARLEKIQTFDRYLLSITLVILIHVLHVSIVYGFFNCCLHYIALMPYGLIYPPLLYFTSLLIYKQKNKINYDHHLIPFFLFFLIYIILLISDSLLDTYGEFLFKTLLLAESVSSLTYSILSIVIFLKSSIRKEIADYINRSYELCLLLVVVEGNFVLIHFISTFSKDQIIMQRTDIINLLFCLIVVSLIIMILIERFLINKENANGIIERTKLVFQKNTKKYQTKNKLKPSIKTNAQGVFNSEKERVDFVNRLKYFEDSNQFLDGELTLSQISKKLHTSDQLLSKYLKNELNTNFNNYLNNLRIKYIVALLTHKLENNVPIKSLEDTYLQAGFKSKSTFNRHFKRVMSQTPTEFIDSFKNMLP